MNDPLLCHSLYREWRVQSILYVCNQSDDVILSDIVSLLSWCLQVLRLESVQAVSMPADQSAWRDCSPQNGCCEVPVRVLVNSLQARKPILIVRSETWGSTEGTSPNDVMCDSWWPHWSTLAELRGVILKYSYVIHQYIVRLSYFISQNISRPDCIM